jgi:hypothetical protein
MGYVWVLGKSGHKGKHNVDVGQDVSVAEAAEHERESFVGKALDVGKARLRGKGIDSGEEFNLWDDRWRRVWLVCWGGDARLFFGWRVFLGFLEELGEVYLAEGVVIHSVIEPSRNISDRDVNALFLPLSCDATNVVVKVVGELGLGLLEIIQRHLFKEDSVSLDVIGIDWKSVRVGCHGTAEDRIQQGEDTLSGTRKRLFASQRP